MKKKGAPRRRVNERRYQQTDDYPINAPNGHDYVVKCIPETVWRKARERAQVQRRSIRWVLISLLEQYSKGQVTP